MSNFMKSSNSSGKCLYCNTFFHRLATHMLSSETCMLASQTSLSHKRICCNNDIDKVSVDYNNTSDETGSSFKKPHLQTEQDGLVIGIQQLSTNKQSMLQHNDTCEDDLCSKPHCIHHQIAIQMIASI